MVMRTCLALGWFVLLVPCALGAEPSADVAALLDRVNTSYLGLSSAEFDGHIIGHFDVAGEKKNDDIPFTSSFRAPNQFKHDAKGDVLLGSTGQTAYAFEPGKNIYISSDAPKERSDLSDWPRAITGILQQQNPSLLLALTKNPGGALKDLGPEMKQMPDSQLEGKAYPTIQFELPPEHRVVTFLIEPKTALLRQARFDLRKSLEARGATDVKLAEVTVDYTSVTTGGNGDSASYAWAPPAGAILAASDSGAGNESDVAKAMVGKPAPDFLLSGLDGKEVKLASLKGSVVLLDFWATWCGPCVMSMPHTDALYKEESGRGLKVFAVDVAEEKDVVKAFVEQKKWSLPILLDVQGDVARQYGAGDAIPEAVVVGKDGIVKKVFVGVGDSTAEEIKAAVEKEMGN